MGRKIFICYSHSDRQWLTSLKRFLEPYKLSGELDTWDDTDIEPGEEWRQKIEGALNSAKAAVCLVSSNFFASKFITEIELPVLLRRAAEEGVRILWIPVAPHRAEHDLSKFQCLLRPPEPLSKLNKHDREDALVEIADKIYHFVEARPSERASSNFSRTRDTSGQNIHLLTSVKGGVGKTLVSLGIACNYYFQRRNRGLIAIDMNTMNPDLFRILSSFVNADGPSTYEKVTEWEHAYPDKDNSIIEAFAPKERYVLPDGALGFWEKLMEIIELPEIVDGNRDIVIDTNLHISNVANVIRSKGLNRIESILESNRTRTIYFWIFWTWAAFQESDPIRAALLQLKRFGSRTSIVHVLNPSALLPPQIDRSSQIKLTDALKTLLRGSVQLLGTVPSLRHKDFVSALELMIETIEAPNENSQLIKYPIPGLADLAQAHPKRPITFKEFERICKFFQGLPPDATAEETFLPVYEILVNGNKDVNGNIIKPGFGGRPSNVLPISTDDPDLIGYTEAFARRAPEDMNAVKGKIGAIEADIDNLLEHLSPSQFE
jgi:hypothetical protein